MCMCGCVRETHWACGYAGMHVNMYYGVTMIEITTRIKTIPLFYLSAFGCSVESWLAVQTYWLSRQNKLQSCVYRIEVLKVLHIASNMLEMYHGLWLAKKLIWKLFLTCLQSTQVDSIFNRPHVLTMLSLHNQSSLLISYNLAINDINFENRILFHNLYAKVICILTYQITDVLTDRNQLVNDEIWNTSQKCPSWPLFACTFAVILIYLHKLYLWYRHRKDDAPIILSSVSYLL